MRRWNDIVLSVPAWLEAWGQSIPDRLPEKNQRMAVVIELAKKNLQHGGGPFGAAVFNRRSGELVAPGVNWVVPGKSSLLHAEIMALALSEQILGDYEMAKHGSFELVTSVEPCCQCLGVLMWSGVSSLVCGAYSEDAEAIGFKEGPRLPDWEHQLIRRGIDVTLGIMRLDALSILQEYQGEIYNSCLDASNSNKL